MTRDKGERKEQTGGHGTVIRTQRHRLDADNCWSEYGLSQSCDLLTFPHLCDHELKRDWIGI